MYPGLCGSRPSRPDNTVADLPGAAAYIESLASEPFTYASSSALHQPELMTVKRAAWVWNKKYAVIFEVTSLRALPPLPLTSRKSRCWSSSTEAMRTFVSVEAPEFALPPPLVARG